MNHSTKKRNPASLTETARKVYSGVVNFFTCVIIVIFPLYYENYYYNILMAKYRFYWMTILAMIAVCLILGIAFLFIDKMEFDGANGRRFFARFKPSKMKNQPLTYKAVMLFWVFAALATVLSDYRYEAFWGNEGRYSGLFLISLYVLSVFIIGKLGRFRKWHLELLLLSGLLVCLFGISDYFHMDILGWKQGIADRDADIFVSFIGNVNTYTAYVGMIMAVACGLFVTEKNPIRMIYHYGIVVVSFFAMVTGQSDNAYLALGALFIFLPFVVFKSWKGVGRYAILAATFFTTIDCVKEMNDKMADRVIGFHGIFDYLANYEKLKLLVIIMWILAAVLVVSSYVISKNSGKKQIGKWLRILWSVVLVAALLCIIYVCYDANFGSHSDKYEALSRYLIFNDDWGSSRGYCWRIGWETYMDQPLVHKLFGFGPDTYGILTWDYRSEALSLYGEFYESAHNEYLQYLVTMGPVALLFYLLFLGSGIKRLYQRIEDTPWILAPALAVLCYVTQAVVNINLPIATPVMWTLMAVGLAVDKQYNCHIKESSNYFPNHEK